MSGKVVDLFMFMGQSNMAGRGISTPSHPETAPTLVKGAGYEYRAVSSPDKLHVAGEPFGKNENRSGGIDDGDMKTGSLVTSFINTYYKITRVPIVGISASKGGSRISQWQPDGLYLSDAIARLKAASEFLSANGYVIRHKFMVWCQGESDGDIATPSTKYRADFENMLEKMLENGIEKCFLIKIGNYNGRENYDYGDIRRAQEETARENKDVVMVSTMFGQMKERGLMKDSFHYFQQAYNEVGADAGERTAKYVVSLDEEK